MGNCVTRETGLEFYDKYDHSEKERAMKEIFEIKALWKNKKLENDDWNDNKEALVNISERKRMTIEKNKKIIEESMNQGLTKYEENKSNKSSIVSIDQDYIASISKKDGKSFNSLPGLKIKKTFHEDSKIDDNLDINKQVMTKDSIHKKETPIRKHIQEQKFVIRK